MNDVAANSTELWTWFQRGGPLMWPLLLASVLAVAIIIEKLLTLRQSVQTPEKLSNLVKPHLLNGDYDGLLQECTKSGTPLGRLVAALLHERHLHREDLKDLLVEKGREELQYLRRRLPILGTIAQVSPLIGLLGTVLGMIEVFGVISAQGLKYDNLSSGISEALLTTAAGLIVAIPVFVAYRFFASKVEDVAHALEQEGLMVIRLLKPTKGPGTEKEPRGNETPELS